MLANQIRKVNQVADFLNGLLLGIIVVGVLISVFGRYLFQRPVPGLMDAAYFAMLGCMFLQTGKALYEGKHIATSLLKDRVGGRAAAALETVANLVILICGVAFVWYSIRFTWDSFVRNWYYSGSLAVPMYLLYGIMTLGSVFLSVVAVMKLLESLQEMVRR
jgi:TRAP-type C4-dicarboxylate transport system permease small subunit